jgi:serine/threonine protein kinase
MEIYEGGDLVTLIRRNNANFPTDDKKSFMYDLLKGLNYLETLKIMHRDIKPENIMIRKKDGQNELIIGDFGLASYTELPKYLL